MDFNGTEQLYWEEECYDNWSQVDKDMQDWLDGQGETDFWELNFLTMVALTPRQGITYGKIIRLAIEQAQMGDEFLQRWLEREGVHWQNCEVTGG